ncbi:hypothetical protein ZIOFF_003163 [Zingiber officinale]|uniref:ENTH domain-containing protein n=1 Tax=Zingiber officinale TaxID=94328 RepID=A0A8J5ICT2_ZINOF|nr:hypothetical protein ZIOFF_003163 [Zingiber officinale]
MERKNAVGWGKHINSNPCYRKPEREFGGERRGSRWWRVGKRARVCALGEGEIKVRTGWMGTWRKAYGALKDSTKVGLAKVNSEFKDLDIAIVKATNHVECPPKERHVRTIFAATSVVRPRADVAYCIYALGRRLSKTHNWTVCEIQIL